MVWRVSFFGGALLADGAGRPVRLAGRRADALLARLAMEPGRPVARRALAALLWPERDGPGGLGALRQAVHLIRQATAPGVIEGDRAGIGLAPGAVETDLGRLADEATMLAAARELRDGLGGAGDGAGFLAGLAVAGPAHAGWLEHARALAERRAGAALGRLAAAELAAGAPLEASLAARVWLALEPRSEAAVRALAESERAMGEPAAARREIRDYARRAEAAGQTPSAALLALEAAPAGHGVAAGEETVLAALALAAVVGEDAPEAAGRLARLLTAMGAADVKARQATVSALFGERGLRASVVAAAVDTADALARAEGRARIGIAVTRVWRAEDGRAGLREVDRARAVALAAEAAPGEIRAETALKALSGAEDLAFAEAEGALLLARRPGAVREARPFVGRAAECAQIGAAAEAVEAGGAARVLVVSGAPGIGKTALIGAALGAAPGLAVIRAKPAAGPAGSADLLGPLLAALEAGVAGEGAGEGAGEAAGEGARQAASDAVPDAGAKREGHVDRIARLIGGAAGAQVVVIEDAETVGEADARALAGLIERLQDCAILWLFAARSERRGAQAALAGLAGVVPLAELTLAHLARADAEAIAAGYGVGAAARAACVARAGGNPLFLHQLLMHQAEETAPDAPAGSAVPASIEEAILARLDALDTAAVATLRLAAILGDAAPERALRQIGAVGSAVLESLAARRLIRREGGAIWVDHGLIRDAILSVTPAPARARAHARAAAWFEGRDPERHARHLLAAGDARAGEALLGAARGAAAAGRQSVAADLAAAGAGCARSGALRAALRIEEAAALAASGALARAEATYEAARHLSLDRALRADALIGAANVQRLQDRTAPGLALLAEAEPLLGAEEAARHARLLITRGRLLFAAGAAAESRAAYLAAEARAEAAGLAALEIEALGGLADAAYAQGDMPAADTHAAAAMAACARAGLSGLETVQRAFRAHVMVYNARLAEARAMAEHAAAEAAERYDWRAEINARLGIASGAFCADDLAACAEAAGAAARLAARSGARRFDLVAGLYRARLAIARGEAAEAARLLEALRAPLEAVNPQTHGAQLALLDALVAGRPAEMAARLEEAEAALEAGAVAHNALRVLPVAALLWHRLGERGRARAALARLRCETVTGRSAWAERHAAGIGALLEGGDRAGTAKALAALGFRRLAAVLRAPEGATGTLLVC